MFLYLMRHGEAVKMGGEIRSDAARTLTEYGRMQAKTVALELKRRKISARLISSPYVRAVQTAEILAEALHSEPVFQEAELAARGHAPDLDLILKRHAGVESLPTGQAGLILIGHQPDIGMLVERLLGFELGFGTAVLAGFESVGPKWRYLWSLIPEDLFQK